MANSTDYNVHCKHSISKSSWLEFLHIVYSALSVMYFKNYIGMNYNLLQGTQDFLKVRYIKTCRYCGYIHTPHKRHLLLAAAGTSLCLPTPRNTFTFVIKVYVNLNHSKQQAWSFPSYQLSNEQLQGQFQLFLCSHDYQGNMRSITLTSWKIKVNLLFILP